MSWPTVAELGDHLGAPIAAGETAHAQAMLDAARAKVQGFTSQRLEAATDTVVLEADGYRLFLPELPVTAVVSVTVDGALLASSAYAVVAETGYLNRVDGRPWSISQLLPWSPPQVAVNYTHGYAVIPADVRTAVLELAALRFGNPTGATSEQIGNYSYRNDAPGPAEAEVLGRLHRYRSLGFA